HPRLVAHHQHCAMSLRTRSSSSSRTAHSRRLPYNDGSFPDADEFIDAGMSRHPERPARDTYRSVSASTRCRLRLRRRNQQLQQRRLAGPLSATQDEPPTLTRPPTLQQSIEDVAHADPTKESRPFVTIRYASHQAPRLGIATSRRVRKEGALVMGIAGRELAGKLDSNNLLGSLQ